MFEMIRKKKKLMIGTGIKVLGKVGVEDKN